jgi:hypothetical protein
MKLIDINDLSVKSALVLGIHVTLTTWYLWETRSDVLKRSKPKL